MLKWLNKLIGTQPEPSLKIPVNRDSEGPKLTLKQYEHLADEGDQAAARLAMQLHNEMLTWEQLEAPSGRDKCISLAESGDRIAMMRLVMACAGNFGFESDVTQMLKWCKRSAEGGWAEAQFMLAGMYAAGRGIDQGPDYPTAAYWYGMAVKLGHPGAMHALALLYLNGQGVQQSIELALYWYFLSLHDENPVAMEWMTGFPNNKNAIKRGIQGSRASKVFASCELFLQEHPRFAERHYINTASRISSMFVSEFI